MRTETKRIVVGGVPVGGGAAIAIQSMTNTDTRDVRATAAQIEGLLSAGCNIVRCAVPDMEAARALGELKRLTKAPLVADIHFDYRLAIESVRQGADKIRINPGNIGGPDRIKAVVDACRERGVPIRVGVNGGSLERELLHKYGGPTARALAESALKGAELLMSHGFEDICLSVKSSSVKKTIEAFRILAAKCDFPLHLGVTEAGTSYQGAIKNAVGIGALLCDGIGDTIRVSLTDEPVEEIRAAKAILRACGLGRGPEIISCPTCGRCRVDLITIANEVERRLEGYDADLKVAVMGCAVNGPGEAREADVGIAGGDGEGILFRAGKIIAKAPQGELVARLFSEIDDICKE